MLSRCEDKGAPCTVGGMAVTMGNRMGVPQKIFKSPCDLAISTLGIYVKKIKIL